jgi:CDP-glycerol glycerophosphotransferase
MNSSLLAGAVVRSALLDSFAIEDESAPALVISGPLSESGLSEAATASLVGARLSLSAPLTFSKSRWTAAIPLVASRWGGPVLAAPSGHYRLELSTIGGPVPLAVASAVPAETLIPGYFRVGFEIAEETTFVVLSAPLTDRERGPAQQDRLEAEYRATNYPPKRAVFFESFYGQYASCNPRAIDRAIATLLPTVERYWSVKDASVAVPDGAQAIIEGSEEWWRIRGSARLIVINDWMRKRFRRRSHQTVLQTWHGTMLKKIGMDRQRRAPRAMVASWLESRRWDVLLAQNSFSSKIFRSAYKFTGPIWEEGYPRDDVLTSGDAAAVRARLGIEEGVTAVLYAPTWRDDRPDQVDHLDVARFADSLGPDFVTLIRGHSRTLAPGRDLHGTNVIDVTGYPDVSELFLAADLMITDYSSVMFDFSVTGKPILFYTPDLEHYRKQLRGFYFDLIEVAPGPVVETADELISLIRQRDAVHAEYADKYALWRERFNPRDDGHAAERVVVRLLASGAIA